jgi:peptide/nickel transport system permease protein
MRFTYLFKRFGIFVLIVWLASSVNFFLPRFGGQDPMRAHLLEQAMLGGYVQAGLEEMVAEYNVKFGLDKPLWQQYLNYLGDVVRLDFNYSVSNYPRTVASMLADALPWTIGLLLTTTLLAFAIGTMLGAILGWPGAPHWLRFALPPLMALNAIPFFLLGLILIYLVTTRFPFFPLFGGYSPGTLLSATLDSLLDVLRHAILPATSIVLVAIGGWALGMRAMMVTTQGEDYTVFADAKGLRPFTIFLRYSVRNALLPQATALALVLGHIASGAVLVEVIFGYPGIGTVLYNAIRQSDYFLIQGIVFGVIVSLGFATFILDLIYPLLDPRITYRRG